ncbi:MAG: NAD-dependent epimerase/dehydratase [Micrococcaceae bacterium]|jgi:uncharacterized protein YbjT (DUF2867 family)|nr:NAD-dependent epimerase/dehydratase [Micrococcaceae bacterium]
MTRIAILGGHGKVALELATLLHSAGHSVTSFIRADGQAQDVTAAGGTPQLLDLEGSSTEQLAEALRGHDAVVWSAGAGGGNPGRTYAVDRDAAIRSMEAARLAGVKRYVMVSYLGAGPNHGVPADNGFYAYAEAKAAADEHLRASELDWTILGPGALTLEPGSGKITLRPGSDTPTSTSRANVAQVAAAVLESPETVGCTIPFADGSTPIAEALAGLQPDN